MNKVQKGVSPGDFGTSKIESFYSLIINVYVNRSIDPGRHCMLLAFF